VQRAREVLEQGATELIAEVEQGRMSVSLGAKVAKAPKKTQVAVAKKTKAGAKPAAAVREAKAEELAANPVPSLRGKYRVIYADPPWNYADKCDEGAVQGQGAAQHYPPMTIVELCALPVRALAEDDAVLFLWVTSPLLYNCAPVIDAWGFSYRASFVWDKVKHNMGHYNSVRHEFLLVCVRGSCQPDVRKLYDSVVVEERTAHSAKPETFRTMIDTLYPHGKRIELFARGPAAKGWATWGNQA
jgi:N6-adenosine-specific RNA methylase IME4